MLNVFPSSLWCLPSKNLLLRNDEVHVWRDALDLKESHNRSLEQILSADERARANRLYFQKDREHFIIARGLLRVILGRYLNREPSQLRFCYNPYGKPALANNDSDKNDL